MADDRPDMALKRGLATCGSDLSRWPADAAGAARAALLSHPAFRRAWEAERRLDRALDAHRDDLDRRIVATGMAERIRDRLLARTGAGTAAPRWRNVAAAVLAAVMLGGAMDVIVTEPGGESIEAAALDPLFAEDDPLQP